MAETHWTDQPKFLEQGETIFPHVGLREARSAQIILLEGRYYLTVGNLFGSDTVSSTNLKHIGQILQAVSDLDAFSIKSISIRKWEGVRVDSIRKEDTVG